MNPSAAPELSGWVSASPPRKSVSIPIFCRSLEQRPLEVAKWQWRRRVTERDRKVALIP